MTSNTYHCIVDLKEKVKNDAKKETEKNKQNKQKQTKIDPVPGTRYPVPPSTGILTLLPCLFLPVLVSRVHMLRKEHGKSRPSLDHLQVTMFPWKPVIRPLLPRLTMLIPQYALRCFHKTVFIS